MGLIGIMTRFISLFFIGIFFVSVPAWAEVKDLGKFAETYPIAEKDAIEEIQQKAKNLDMQSLIDPIDAEAKITSFKPKTIFLPKAAKERRFLVDITHTLEFDVMDKDGNVVYPAGYQINPLEHINNPMTYIFIDASDEDQVNWLINSAYADSLSCRVLITDGEYFELTEQLGRPVYYALDVIVERFQLEYVPSVVFQSGKHMKVHEVNIETN